MENLVLLVQKDVLPFRPKSGKIDKKSRFYLNFSKNFNFLNSKALLLSFYSVLSVL